MAASDLQQGFRLGDWLVDPRGLQITSRQGSVALDSRLMCILVCLVEHHGEIVDWQALRRCAAPGETLSDDDIRACVHELRMLLGDSVRQPRYIIAVPHQGYAVIAHFEPPAAVDDVSLPTDVVLHPAAAPLIKRTQHFCAELQRRHVLKVLGAYLVGIWLVLQIAETTFEPLHFPDWWMTALTILAVIGVPVISSLAWSYEITASGVVLDPGDTAHLHVPRARRAVAPLLVIGVALMAGVTGLAWWHSLATQSALTQPATAVPTRTIAVLPLDDHSPTGGSPYVAVGLTEELAALLARVPGLRVAPPRLAFDKKIRGSDSRKAGQALGAEFLLGGDVRREGDRLHVTVHLVSARDGRQLWEQSYDRYWRDVFATQREIAQSVANAIGVAPTGLISERERQADFGNLRAYDTYLAGVAEMRSSGDLSRLGAASELFHRALAIDPNLVRAMAGLCEASVARYERTLATDDIADAETHCRRALEFDASLRETELALAKLYLTSGRHEQAEAVFRGLVARNPGDADAHAGLGSALHAHGENAEAERHFRRAIEVEPRYAGAFRALGGFLFSVGRPGEAEAAYRKVTELNPRSASAFSNLGAALLMQGELSEAAQALQRAIELEPSRAAHTNLGNAYYYLGRFAEALAQHERAQALAALDHHVVGNLADAMWMIPDLHARASGEYGRAMQLATEALRINPADAASWAQLAYYARRAGDEVAATRARVRAEVLGHGDMYVHYYLGLTEADHDDPVAAAAAIRRAQRLGYPQRLLEADPVLRSLTPPLVTVDETLADPIAPEVSGTDRRGDTARTDGARLAASSQGP